MKKIKFVVFVFAALFIKITANAASKIKNGQIGIQVTCSLKPLVVTTIVNVEGKSISVKLPVNTISIFKSGKDKGCAAVTKHAKTSHQSLPVKSLTNFTSGSKITVALPGNENGSEFELSYDLLILKKADGQWLSGPVILAGGLENYVENQVISATSTEVIVNQISSGEGETSTEKITFEFQGDSWVQLRTGH